MPDPQGPGDTIVVGARAEASAATGVNGDRNDTSAPNAGAAYVYVRNGTGWVLQAYLKASNTGAEDGFGRVVAIDGDTIVVGARDEDGNSKGVNGPENNNGALSSGAAYVFVRSAGVWTQQAYLKASNAEAFDSFGCAVAVSGDTILVGAEFESSDARTVNGDQNNNLAGTSGAAYVFVRSGTTWTQQAYLKSANSDFNHQFGAVAALDGDTAVIGAIAESNSGTGVNPDPNQGTATFSGAAFVFFRNGTTWTQQAYLKASNTGALDIFGVSAAVHGDTVVVGARGESSLARGVNGNQDDDSGINCGAAYVFARDGGSWTQQAYLKASDTDRGDRFGNGVAVRGDMVAVGATHQSSPFGGIDGVGEFGSTVNSGTVYVFVRNGGAWSQDFLVKASPPVSSANLGAAVALSTDHLVCGAPGGRMVHIIGEYVEPPPPPPSAGPSIVSIHASFSEAIPGIEYVQLECAGAAGVLHDILRSYDLVSGWEWVGQVEAQMDGTFSFTDHFPYPDRGFYTLSEVPGP